jgi:para-aminobenzoate synthetase component 1
MPERPPGERQPYSIGSTAFKRSGSRRRPRGGTRHGMIGAVTEHGQAAPPGTAAAWFAGRLATGLLEVTDDRAALDTSGWWAVALTYEGSLTAARFDTVEPAPLPHACWPGIPETSWRTSMDQAEYVGGVQAIRAAIAAGDVYQANLCRVLSAPLPTDADVAGLARLLAAGNPAPYGGFLRLPDHGVHVATASPELFLRRSGPGGTTVESGPIKGTGRTQADLKPKDEAENVMIVDLVRNDLSRVCRPGTVSVPSLLAVEQHPGLVHLVSTVRGELVPGVGWPGLLDAAFPPGSVTGAPKSSALRIIDGLEREPRGVYCGAVGWVDGASGRAELAVAIRTFWVDGPDTLRFGTGAGITWGSDPYGEWVETQLKASRLLAVAAKESRG